MRIAQLVPLLEKVPPPAYGGIELVVGLPTDKTDELVSRGYKVSLFATEDTLTPNKLEATYPGDSHQPYERINPEEVDFFRQEVKPYLDGQPIEYFDAADHAMKNGDEAVYSEVLSHFMTHGWQQQVAA